jgi:hypothetical protein
MSRCTRPWLEHGPGPVQEVVASIILGPGQWDGWHAKWNEQYAQWARTIWAADLAVPVPDGQG